MQFNVLKLFFIVYHDNMFFWSALVREGAVTASFAQSHCPLSHMHHVLAILAISSSLRQRHCLRLDRFG